MSLLVGLRVSSRSPLMDGTTRLISRFDRSASRDSNSAHCHVTRHDGTHQGRKPRACRRGNLRR
jgi:hypothetical protein